MSVVEDTRLILETKVTKPKAEAKWFKDGQLLISSEGMEITQKGDTHQLIVQKVTLEDGGTYSIKAGGVECKSKLTITGILPSYIIIIYQMHLMLFSISMAFMYC